MASERDRMSRRRLLNLGFAAAVGGMLLAALGALWSFLSQGSRKDASRVLLGGVSGFPVGSKTLYRLTQGKSGLVATKLSPPQFKDDTPVQDIRRAVWLVRLETGFLALDADCTHLTCFVPWRAEFRYVDPRDGHERSGWFRCPCHGATFDDAGVRVFGPAARSLDRYDVRVAGGNVYVDGTALREGTADNARFAVDPARAS